MLNKPSALRMVSRIFFATFFSLSVAALPFKEAPPSTGVPAVPAEPLASPDATAPETAAAPSGKVVYKSVDSAGNVTFTDSAPIGRPSEAIRVQAANLVPGRSEASGVGAADTLKEGEEPVNYTITITSPVADTLFGQEAESVALVAKLEPSLQEGHTFQLYYDGKPVGNGDTAYSVTVMERGTHTVEARVFDSEKKVVKSATPVKFHIRRISKLLPESNPTSDKDNKAPANPNGPKLDASADKKDAGAPSAKGEGSNGGVKSDNNARPPALGAGGSAMGAGGAGGAR